MILEQIIAYTYLIIALLFVFNFYKIVEQIKNGKTKLNFYSLLATSSLVSQFLALSYYFHSHQIICVFYSQLYILICMLYIKLFNKKENKS